MMSNLAKIYDLRITLMSTEDWTHYDLFFHFLDIPLADKWITNFFKLKNSDHNFRERIVNVSGKGVDIERATTQLTDLIQRINLYYDLVLPLANPPTQDWLSLLHTYYEGYGVRTDFKRNEDTDQDFLNLNAYIHKMESILLVQHKPLEMFFLSSFNPRIDFLLEDEDFKHVLPIITPGDLRLGYNTLGRNLSQAITAHDSELLKNNNVSPQQYWSNEINVSLKSWRSAATQLLEYRKDWNATDTGNYEYGNFSKNREGYIVIGEMIPEQKDKLFSFRHGLSQSIAKYNAIHSIDIMPTRQFRDLDSIVRIPEWKTPNPVQGPKIIKIKNQGVVHITWLLNNICNYSCRYCPDILHNGINPKHNWDQLVPFIDQLISFYASDAKTLNFALTGGEPTLSPFFPTMVKKIYDLGHRVGLTTNLSRTIRYITENFIYLDYASCSFHPAYEFPNNTADQYLEKLKTCSTITSTSVRVMMDPSYWDECVEFVEKVKLIPGVKINPVMIDPQYGFSSRKITDIEYSTDQLEWFKTFSYESAWIEKENSLHRLVDKFSYMQFADLTEEKITNPQELINRGQTNFWNWQCNIGSESLFIDHDGNIKRANCGVSGNVGSIDNWQEINWEQLSQPISCTTTLCHCGTDVLVSKRKVD